jgi:hypothetical protein
MNQETLIVVLVSACLIVNLITLTVVFLSRKSLRATAAINEQNAKLQVAAALSKEQGQGIVFCRNCGNQFDSTLDVCPHCNRAR